MSSSGQVLQDMTSLLRHALEKSHGLDPRLCSQCGKISELLGYTVNTNFPPVSSKAAEAPGGQACACAEVGRVYPFNGKHFCSNCKRQVITPNWRGFSDRVARLIWPDNSEAFPGMSSPEQVAANKTLNERQWKSISDLIFNEISAMAAPAVPSERDLRNILTRLIEFLAKPQQEGGQGMADCADSFLIKLLKELEE